MNQELFEDFIAWAGTARRAASLIGVDETRLSKIRRGRAKRWADEAVAIERATGGRYLAADLLGLTPSDSEAA